MTRRVVEREARRVRVPEEHAAVHVVAKRRRHAPRQLLAGQQHRQQHAAPHCGHGRDEEATHQVRHDIRGHHEHGQAFLAQVRRVEHDGDAVRGVRELEEQWVHEEADDEPHDLGIGRQEQRRQAPQVQPEDESIHRRLRAEEQPRLGEAQVGPRGVAGEGDGDDAHDERGAHEQRLADLDILPRRHEKGDRHVHGEHQRPARQPADQRLRVVEARHDNGPHPQRRPDGQDPRNGVERHPRPVELAVEDFGLAEVAALQQRVQAELLHPVQHIELHGAMDPHRDRRRRRQGERKPDVVQVVLYDSPEQLFRIIVHRITPADPVIH
mmetsp:Transcript_15687/g.54469  ORF Transcript_15687/g.54469 Transcript_15687/m.54469 type:complete len:325 (-) Transcript_15687:393-1367(-)